MRRAVGVLLAISGMSPVGAEVPITIAASGHATVPVTGTFGTDQFVFDTGAEGSAVYAPFADRAGFKPAGTEILQGQTGLADSELVTIDTLVLDGVRKNGFTAVRLAPRADGVPLAGIVGLDVFGDRTIDFDLPGGRIELHPPGTLPEDLESAPVAAAVTVGNLLTIPVAIDGHAAVAVIDTGARKSRINWKLGRALGIDPASLTKGDTIQGATNRAVETSATRVRAVTLGAQTLVDAPVLVADLPVFEAFGVSDKPAIILGMDWLADTRMVIDFPGRRVWFEAARTAKR